MLILVMVELTPRRTNRGRPNESKSTLPDRSRDITPTRHNSATVSTNTPAQPAGVNSSYSSYKTAEERAAFVKQQAEQRLAERLAALGLKAPTKSGETTQQRQEREARERDERLRQAQAEDAKRDEERQRRLAEEQPSPPRIAKPSSKKPPPPPARKVRGDSVGQQAEMKRKSEEVAQKQKEKQEAAERSIKEKQQAQEAEIKQLEYVFRGCNLKCLANCLEGMRHYARSKN